MASVNVDLVRSIHAAWERGDFSSADWAHPEIELVIADGPAPSSWTGLSGLVEGYRGFVSAWEEFRIEADEYRELDDERVLVLTHAGGRGKTSGLEVGQMQADGASVFHVRGGKVARLVVYVDRETGLPTSACRSKTLTRTPDPGGYCAGDVAGERGGGAGAVRALECGGCRGLDCRISS